MRADSSTFPVELTICRIDLPSRRGSPAPARHHGPQGGRRGASASRARIVEGGLHRPPQDRARPPRRRAAAARRAGPGAPDGAGANRHDPSRRPPSTSTPPWTPSRTRPPSFASWLGDPSRGPDRGRPAAGAPGPRPALEDPRQADGGARRPTQRGLRLASPPGHRRRLGEYWRSASDGGWSCTHGPGPTTRSGLISKVEVDGASQEDVVRRGDPIAYNLSDAAQDGFEVVRAEPRPPRIRRRRDGRSRAARRHDLRAARSRPAEGSSCLVVEPTSRSPQRSHPRGQGPAQGRLPVDPSPRVSGWGSPRCLPGGRRQCRPPASPQRATEQGAGPRGPSSRSRACMHLVRRSRPRCAARRPARPRWASSTSRTMRW